MATKLDPLFARNIKDGVEALIFEVQRLEALCERYEKALIEARDNIGVPQPGYPAPVGHAYDVIQKALSGQA